ncbi:MAG TPA: YciI family protein [Kribbellaceae bacterium]|nr:YciI family protein [Kribbellaceae bacterium]
MQYALLIYVDPHAQDDATDDERRAVTAEYLAIRDDARIAGGAHLQQAHTATTIRVQDGSTLVTDGPFADTKEVFGGYYVFEADDLDAAIEVASRIPAARMGGAVEVRPLVELPVRQ